MASCEYAITSTKLRGKLVVKTPKTMPVIELGHLYQPPSVIVPNAIQIAFKVTSELLPSVALNYVI